ncbi:MAG: hypothetical protein M1269_13125 [Chloroflexi bacterium]|nr:hypothetical protein [Chloroflexota bacterium]
MTSPWAGPIGVNIFLQILVVALLTLWIWYRVNDCKLYLFLGLLLIVQAVCILFFMHEPEAQRWAVLACLGLNFIIMLLTNTLLITILGARLPMIGMDDIYLFDRDKVRFNKIFTVIVSTAFVIVTILLFKNSYMLLHLLLPGFKYYAAIILMIVIFAFLADYIAPWIPEMVDDVAVVRARPRMVPLNALSVTGDVVRGEIIAIPLVGGIIWFALLFVGKAVRTPLDWMGLIFFIIIAAIVIKGEWRKDVRITDEIVRSIEQEKEAERRRRIEAAREERIK